MDWITPLRRGFLRFFILEELAKDVDGYAFSNYAP